VKQFQGINQASVIEVIGYDRKKHRELMRLYICHTALIMWLDHEIKKESDAVKMKYQNQHKGIYIFIFIYFFLSCFTISFSCRQFQECVYINAMMPILNLYLILLSNTFLVGLFVVQCTCIICT
jgi:hypothetical protein